jgi:Protein of unknown function (DUF3106)
MMGRSGAVRFPALPRLHLASQQPDISLFTVPSSPWRNYSGGKTVIPLRVMRRPLTLRLPFPLTALGVCLAGLCLPVCAQKNHAAPAPHAQVQHASPAPQSQIAGIQRRENPGAKAQKGEHLAEWMNQHSNLTPEQQQQALDREPGFRDLPPQVQQRYHDRLSQLNAMTPEQRQKLLARNEAMEHLSPDQRADVRGAMQQLGGLPIDQRRAVARTFRQLRDLPPEQRMAALNSDPRFRNQFNDAQRSTLNNLLRIEPMLPPPENPAPR